MAVDRQDKCCNTIYVQGGGSAEDKQSAVFATYSIEQDLVNGYRHYTSLDGSRALTFVSPGWILQAADKRGQDFANAKGNGEDVACPSDVTKWQYYDNGWKEAGEDITVMCGRSIEERLEDVEYWVYQNDDRLLTLECREGIIDPYDSECNGRYVNGGSRG